MREKRPNKFLRAHLHLASNPQYSSIYSYKILLSFSQSVKEQSAVLFLLVYLVSHAETFKKFVSLANLTLFPNAVFVYVNFFDKYKTSIAHHFRVMLKIINIYVWPCTFTPFGGLYVN